MKIITRVGFLVGVTVLALSCSIPNTTPAAQEIWKNGVLGSWMGQSETFAPARYPDFTLTTVTDTDAISGDTKTLLLTIQSPPSPAAASCQIAVAQDVTAYLSGHLQFNIKLGTSFTGTSVLVQVIPYPAPVTTPSYSINSAALSTTSYYHVSIPLSQFAPAISQYVTCPFFISAGASSSGPVLYISDVKWTAD